MKISNNPGHDELMPYNSEKTKTKSFHSQLQFIVLLLHALGPLLFGHCYMDSNFIIFLAISQLLVMIFLFGKFYNENYVMKKMNK